MYTNLKGGGTGSFPLSHGITNCENCCKLNVGNQSGSYANRLSFIAFCKYYDLNTVDWMTSMNMHKRFSPLEFWMSMFSSTLTSSLECPNVDCNTDGGTTFWWSELVIVLILANLMIFI